ncbi:hypothetical protein [Pseudomonas aeruginosa]|uniref:hypothetical protein n=1 Tax=Pseudomonas aeruginosa TaxID=287 RepID=UPI002E2D1FE9|nr:hypothetical protein [Pseudomonas aeruginosa]
MQTSRLEYHAYANLFPLLQGNEYEALKRDIGRNGQQEEIVLLDGLILDGRNRYRACLELEIEPATRPFTDADPLAYVLSVNLVRRHLTTAQRAMIAVELSLMGKDLGDDAADPTPTKLLLEDAAEVMGVSPRSVSSARRVVREGAPELVAALKSGQISVHVAEQVSKLPPGDQQELCSKGSVALRNAAKKIATPTPPKGKSASILPVALATTESSSSDSIDDAHSDPGQPNSQLDRKPAALLLFELADAGMQEGREAESIAAEILDAVDDGLDLLLLEFATEVALKLKDRISARKHLR